MASLYLEQSLRMQKVIARLRLVVVLLAGAEFLQSPAHLSGSSPVLATWCAAAIYAGAVLLWEPYRRMSLVVWDVSSGLADWGLISLGMLVTSGPRSDLYVLYFFSVLSIGMRYGLRAVLLAGMGTAAGYLGIVLLASGSWPSTAEIGQRVGYLLLFAMGSGALARQTHRHLQARVREEAHRLAVEEVTATVSHDLKNPLAAVAGLVDMLLDSAADNLSLDQRALLHRIDANTRQMSNLVANLLDAELIGRGLQTFRPAPTDLNALVRRVAEAQAHQAEAKQIGLVLDLNPRLPIAVVDGRMIERLVANLLSNAVKFTPESGAIRVSTHPLGARIGIEVWDSGPGVAPALRSSLFQKFVHQEDTPGIGLGLYICKSVVEQHRGSISVSNAPGGGVAFVAELPVGKPANAAARSSHSGPRRSRAHRAPWHVRRQVGAFMRG